MTSSQDPKSASPTTPQSRPTPPSYQHATPTRPASSTTSHTQIRTLQPKNTPSPRLPTTRTPRSSTNPTYLSSPRRSKIPIHSPRRPPGPSLSTPKPPLLTLPQTHNSSPPSSPSLASTLLHPRNPYPHISRALRPRDLDTLIITLPPSLSPKWIEHELQTPSLRQKSRAPILTRQPQYAAECRSLLGRMISPGARDFNLASGFEVVDIVVPARDGHKIPVRWWQRSGGGTRVTTGARQMSGGRIRGTGDMGTGTGARTGVGGRAGARAGGRGPGLPHPETIVVYVHGGGLHIGESDSEELSCRRILLSSSPSALPNLRVYSVGYRLMPKHPASTCLADTIDAFRHIRQQHPSAKIVLVGSSSGGQLAAFVSQIVPRGQVDGIVLRCPVTSDVFSGISYVPYHLRHMHTSARAEFVNSASSFMRREIPRDGLARMPLEALPEDLEGLPRTWIQLCTNDTLYSDGLCYAKALAESGVQVQVGVMEGWPHTFWLLAPDLDASLEADLKMLRGLEWVASQD